MVKCELLNFPTTVEVGGKEYSLNTDFSVWIEIEHLFLDREERCGVRLAKILALAYPKLPDDPHGALEKVIWFYSGGKRLAEREETKIVSVPLYDLKRDFEYICAGFLGEFGINLLTEDMHWWKFRLLFSCLGEDCKFSKIVGYRSADTSKIKNRELREFFENMKKKYRLPDNRTQEEKEAEMASKIEMLF